MEGDCSDNNMYDLTKKIVLITGGAIGIGAAIAEEVLKEGATHIRILDVDEKAGKQLEIELNKKYGENKAKFVKCDVSDEKELFRAFEETKAENGYLDVVFNNAGVGNESSYAAIRKEIEINFVAVVNGTLKAVEMMSLANGGRGGAVINTASHAALYPICSPLPVYSATKSAILQFAESLGMEPFFTNTGVRILTMCIGTTETSILSKLSSFQKTADEELKLVLKHDCQDMQSPEAAARGAIEVYKKGKCASVWLIHKRRPALDITEDRDKCHSAMVKIVQN